MFETIHKALAGTARGAAVLGGLAMTCAAFMVTADVISRKLFGVTMRGSDEITGYVFAATTTWAYAHCVFTRSNIRIDAAYLALGRRPRALLDVLGLGLLTLYMFLLTRSALTVVEESLLFNYTAQTPMATPLWIPQGFWFAGLAFMLICLTFLCVRAAAFLVSGDWAGINATMGVRSVEQDIAEETHA
ncbi:MAG: TRAP transporter small permease [Pseudomonadota bacterium]